MTYAAVSLGINAAASRPSKVTGLTATDVGSGRSYNNGRIDLAWTAPADNGSAITGYRIDRSTDGITYTTLVSNTGTSATTYSNTGLSSSQIYYYKVAAINAVDVGDYSDPANATATTVPSAPTIGTATAGNASATITFTASATGGKTITTYTSTAIPAAGSGSGSSSPITHTGLTNGTAYKFTVKATNLNGDSTASAESNQVTPVAPPFFPPFFPYFPYFPFFPPFFPYFPYFPFFPPFFPYFPYFPFFPPFFPYFPYFPFFPPAFPWFPTFSGNTEG